MEDCIFCRIINGEFNTEFLYNDENYVAFNDINPQAPIHMLVIPKRHYKSISDSEISEEIITANLLTVAKNICKDLGIQDYRLVINNGEGAGQEVMHLHLHIMSGRSFTWPPG